MDELTYSLICVGILFLLTLRSIDAFLYVTPIMSHMYHILYGEGSITEGDPIWDTYEVAVLLEVLILRLITLRRSPLSALSIALLVFIRQPYLFDPMSLGVEAVIVGLYLIT